MPPPPSATTTTLTPLLRRHLSNRTSNPNPISSQPTIPNDQEEEATGHRSSRNCGVFAVGDWSCDRRNQAPPDSLRFRRLAFALHGRGVHAHEEQKRWLNRLLAARPALNTLLAGLNTVFVAMQLTYILWTFLVEGRLRPGLATLFMFTCRGILGYSTQLPLPQDFLGSGADFPVGNVSFFLFFSGHVAGSVIASLDMRCTQRKELALTFDVLNFMQILRLLGTRGHYTIDLAVGVGAAILFDFLAGVYVESKTSDSGLQEEGKTNDKEDNKISC